jgi:hypothetical protein
VSDELLLRHAFKWARERGRVIDVELLEEGLRLRDAHDGLPANLWPAGSVNDLMLHRWPAHGEGVPDADVLADSLDTFVRFLLVTGRMASGSADPRALAKEAHRAAPKMAAACADTANHGPAKSLLAFGREAGFQLDEVDSMEDLQATLDEVVQAWNALPDDERRARMPLGGDRGPASAALGGAGALNGAGAFGGLQADAEDDLDLSGFLERGDPVRAAEQARQSAYVRECLRLADWVGTRREVTATGVLRLAAARQAYADLELWRWQHENEAISDGGLLERSREFWWRRAGDALPLERLWFAAQGAGLIETKATVARSTGERPQTDDEWVGLAMALMLSLWLMLETDYSRSTVPVLAVLGGCALAGTVTVDQVREQWDDHPTNPWSDAGWMGRTDELDAGDRVAIRRLSDQQLERSLHFFADTGVWTLDGDTFELTDLGREFATVLFGYLEERNG